MAEPKALLRPITVNPNYDFSLEPDENDALYANPVTLNNEVLHTCNALVTLAEAEGQAIRKKQRARLEKRSKEAELHQLQRRLLVDAPLTPTEAKNLQTTAAAITARAEATGVVDELHALEDAIKLCEDEMDRQEAVIAQAQLYWRTGDRLIDGMQTHLSYVKAERGRR